MRLLFLRRGLGVGHGGSGGDDVKSKAEGVRTAAQLCFIYFCFFREHLPDIRKTLTQEYPLAARGYSCVYLLLHVLVEIYRDVVLYRGDVRELALPANREIEIC